MLKGWMFTRVPVLGSGPTPRSVFLVLLKVILCFYYKRNDFHPGFLKQIRVLVCLVVSYSWKTCPGGSTCFVLWGIKTARWGPKVDELVLLTVFFFWWPFLRAFRGICFPRLVKQVQD